MSPAKVFVVYIYVVLPVNNYPIFILRHEPTFKSMYTFEPEQAPANLVGSMFPTILLPFVPCSATDYCLYFSAYVP